MILFTDQSILRSVVKGRLLLYIGAHILVDSNISSLVKIAGNAGIKVKRNREHLQYNKIGNK